MGEILGLGITHYPGLGTQGNLSRRIKICLADAALPEHLRSMENWPRPMREQWASTRLSFCPIESWITNSDKVFAVFRPPLP